MAVALQIVISIANPGAGRPPSRPDFPKVTQADLATAAQLSASAAAAFFSSRFGEQAAQKAAAINKEIDTLRRQIQTLRNQMGAIDAQIAKLEQDKQKALEEAKKAQNTRFVSLPTPTPTPKRL